MSFARRVSGNLIVVICARNERLGWLNILRVYVRVIVVLLLVLTLCQCAPGRLRLLDSSVDLHGRDEYRQHHHHHLADPIMHPDLSRHATAASDNQRDPPVRSRSALTTTTQSSPFKAQAELLSQKLREAKKHLEECGYEIRRLPSLISCEDDAGDDSSNIVSSGGFVAEPRVQSRMPHETEYKLVSAIQLPTEWTSGLGCQWEPAVAREPAVDIDFAIMRAERACEMEWFNNFASA